MKKITITFALILISFLSYSQGQVEVSVLQDGKLFLTGDERGNDALTLNLIIGLHLQGNQQRFGFLEIRPEYEFADLEGGQYQRYSANVGYIFNKLLVNNFEIGASVGHGAIIRSSRAFLSWSFAGVLNYKLNDKFKFTTQVQFTERTDLKVVVLRYSVFFGIQFKVFQPKSRR